MYSPRSDEMVKFIGGMEIGSATSVGRKKNRNNCHNLVAVWPVS